MAVASPETLRALELSVGSLAQSEFRGQTRVVVPRESLADAFTTLRDQRGFDLLVDVTCVDYLNYPDAEHRFDLGEVGRDLRGVLAEHVADAIGAEDRIGRVLGVVLFGATDVLVVDGAGGEESGEDDERDVAPPQAGEEEGGQNGQCK